jgi:hypothetical protein
MPFSNGGGGTRVITCNEIFGRLFVVGSGMYRSGYEGTGSAGASDGERLVCG